MAVIALRAVTDDDADDLFRMMSDPESVNMAAFTAEDPSDRARFDGHLTRLRTDPEITFRVITLDGRVAGSIGSFVMDGETELTYWIDRPLWGRGIAGQAVALFLEVVRVRPLHARAASDNAGSLHVLRKAGFKIQRTEVSYAAGRRADIEETVLSLD
jgi:RimJ/RimL family protein N-acetyltransferase